MNHDVPNALSGPLTDRLSRALEAHSSRWCHPALRQSVPRLAHQVAEHPGQPAEAWQGNVRHILEECCEPVADGDPMLLSPEAFEQLVAVVTRKLDQFGRVVARTGAVTCEPSHWFG